MANQILFESNIVRGRMRVVVVTLQDAAYVRPYCDENVNFSGEEGLMLYVVRRLRPDNTLLRTDFFIGVANHRLKSADMMLIMASDALALLDSIESDDPLVRGARVIAEHATRLSEERAKRETEGVE